MGQSKCFFFENSRKGNDLHISFNNKQGKSLQPAEQGGVKSSALCCFEKKNQSIATVYFY